MRKVMEEKTVYTFNELSSEAKEKVKQWLLDGREEYIFTDMCNEYLSSLFNNSELKVEYSLSYCQGDGLNVYGNLDFDDCLNLEDINKEFTSYEVTTLKEYFEYIDSYKLKSNDRYCQCIIGNQEITEDLIWELEDNEFENIDYDLIKKFEKAVQDYLCNICENLEKDGYAYFYEITEDEALEECECNDYEFLEDGTIY